MQAYMHTNCFNYKTVWLSRETQEEKEWSWASSVAVMQAFHTPLELKRCGEEQLLKPAEMDYIR